MSSVAPTWAAAGRRRSTSRTWSLAPAPPIATLTPMRAREMNGTPSSAGCSTADKRAAEALGHAYGLVLALILDGELGHDVPPAVAELVHRDHLDARSHQQPGRDRRREPDAVESIVDPHLHAAVADELVTEVVEQRQREVAVRDRCAIGTLRRQSREAGRRGAGQDRSAASSFAGCAPARATRPGSAVGDLRSSEFSVRRGTSPLHCVRLQ